MSSGACRARRLRLPRGVHAAWRQAADRALLGVLVLSLRTGQQSMTQGHAPPRTRSPGADLTCPACLALRSA